MIIVRMQGGLGNQLFQYATGRALAHRWGVDLKLDAAAYGSDSEIRNYELGDFCICATLATRDDLLRVQRPRRRCRAMCDSIRSALRLGRLREIPYVLERRMSEFEPGILARGDRLYLDGYWQSQLYFECMRQELLAELTLKTGLDETHRRHLDAIRSSEAAVSLHVRRGDYVTNPTIGAIHDVCDLRYYQRCLTEVSNRIERPHVFVFSDDVAWATTHLEIDMPVSYLHHSRPHNASQELILMSQCRHHIIANSSFSWWGAWLNRSQRKQVFAPAHWYRPGTFTAPDICPTDWRRVSVFDGSHAA